MRELFHLQRLSTTLLQLLFFCLLLRFGGHTLSYALFPLEKYIRYLEKHNPHNRSTTTTIVFFALHIIKIFTHFSTFTHTPPWLAALQQRHHSAAAVFCQWPTNSSASQLFFNTRSVTRSPFSSRSLLSPLPLASFFSALLDHNEENR